MENIRKEDSKGFHWLTNKTWVNAVPNKLSSLLREFSSIREIADNK